MRITEQHISGSHFVAVLRGTSPEPESDEYDFPAPPWDHTVLIQRGGKELKATSPSEILRCLSELGVNMATCGIDDAVPLASCLGYLSDNGRVVVRHELYELVATERGMKLEEFLPCYNEPHLVWHTLQIVDGELSFVRNKLRICQ